MGVNAHQLEVNRCPLQLIIIKETDLWQILEIMKTHRTTIPNSFDDIKPDPSYKKFEEELDSNRVAHFDRNENDNDHYTQPGLLYTKAMNQEDRTNLVNNIIGHMKKIDGPKRDEIINRQLCHFFRANVEMGMRIAAGLQVKLDDGIMNHAK